MQSKTIANQILVFLIFSLAVRTLSSVAQSSVVILLHWRPFAVHWRRNVYSHFSDASTRHEFSCLFRLGVQDGKFARDRKICLNHAYTMRIYLIRERNRYCTFSCVGWYIYETLNTFWCLENDSDIATCHTASFCFLPIISWYFLMKSVVLRFHRNYSIAIHKKLYFYSN